jgi:hypothetical protein
MSGNGAYPEEMAFSHPDIANFSRAVRATLVTEPDPAASAAMVRRLADEARASAAIAAERAQRRPTSALQPTGRRSGARRRLAAVALAVAAVPLLTAGLAVAGVKLPAVADDVFSAIGIELPNQADSAGQGDSDADQDQGSGNDGTPGASPAAEPGSDKAVKGRKRRGNGPPDHSNAGGNQNPGSSSSNGKAKGKPPSPPGLSNKPKNPGGASGGKSATPPGQANRPDSPGGSGFGNPNSG